MRSLRLILPLSMVSLLASAPALAAVIPGTVVVRVGDTPTGADGPVATLQSPFVDSGGALGFTGTLVGGDGFVFSDDAVIFHNSDEVVAVLLGGEVAMGHNTVSGAFVFSPNVGTNAIDGLYTQDGVFNVEGTQAPGMSLGTLSVSHARPSMIFSGAFFWVMDVNDGGVSNRVLAMTPDGDFDTVVTLLEGGDVVDGLTLATGVDGIDFDFQVSFNGIYRINVLGVDGASGLEQVVMVNDVVAAQEGTPADDEVAWENFDLVAIDNIGNSAWSGDSDADSAADEFIAYNGTIVLREGDDVDGVSLGAGSTVRLLSIDEGNMLHTWGSAAAGTETVFYSCDPDNLQTNSVYVIALGDELDFDGDMVGDGMFITDFAANSANDPQRGLGNDGSIFLEVEVDDGAANEAIIRLDPPPCCGNEVVETGEECDDGDIDDTDECIDCVAAVCGDGFVQVGVEECDDANDVDTDACAACQDAACGDGFVQDGVEECDDGNGIDTDECVACVPAACGDGSVQEGVEECDDGNDVDDDECANDCTETTVATGSSGEPTTSDTDVTGSDTEPTSGDTDGTTTGTGTGSASATSPSGTDASATATSSDTDTDTDSGGGGGVGDDGCGCTTDAPMSPAAPTLLGLMLLGLTRRRPRLPTN